MKKIFSFLIMTIALMNSSGWGRLLEIELPDNVESIRIEFSQVEDDVCKEAPGLTRLPQKCHVADAMVGLVDHITDYVAVAMEQANIDVHKREEVIKILDSVCDNVEVLLHKYESTTRCFCAEEGHVCDESCKEEKEMIASGLSQIFTNVINIAINPSCLGFYVKNIVVGILRVVLAVMADGKVDQSDWVHVCEAINDMASDVDVGAFFSEA